MARQNGEGGVKIHEPGLTPYLSCGSCTDMFNRLVSYRHILAQETIAPAVVSALVHVASFGRAVPLSLSLLSGLCCRWP